MSPGEVLEMHLTSIETGRGVLSKWRPVIQVLYVIVQLTDPPCCIGLLLPFGIALVFKNT